MMMKNLSLIILTISILSIDAFASRQKTVGDILDSINKQGLSKLNAKKRSAAIPKTGDIKAVRPKNISKIKPARTRAIMTTDKETQALENVIDQSINELYKLTQKYKRSPNRGELWLRLGELYVEKAKLIEIRIYEAYDKALNRYHEKKRRTKPKLDLELARDYNRKAIQLYKWFVRDFPNDRKVDQALFFLGYNNFQIGNEKTGARYYEILNKKYPRSNYVSESNFSLGEFYFDNNQWKNAGRAYNKVVRKGDPKLISFALYKKAWSLHRLGRTRSALDTLEKVIEVGLRQQKRKIKLVAEAQRDMVLFYANVGSPKRARSYLSRHIEKEELRGALEKLGYLYANRGNREGARVIFEDLISRKPTASEALDFQFQLVDLYSTGNQNVYLRELNEFMRNYAPESDWAKANPSKLRDSQNLRESVLRNHTLNNHKQYQKSQSKIARKLAKAGYELYLSYFPKGEHIAEVNFFYGELLFEEKKYRAAAKAYDTVVKNGKGTEYYEKALNNALISLEKLLPSDKEIRNIVGESVERFQMPGEVKLFVSVASRYSNLFSEPKRVAEIKFRVGRLYYLYNHFAEAEAAFKDITNNHPRTEYAKLSTNLILDIYNLRQDYAGLAVAGEELLRNQNLSSSGATKDIKNVLEKASFKNAQDLEESKNYLESAKAFQLFSQKHPASDLAFSAIYNAGVNYERAGNTLLALAMYSKASRSPTKNKEEEKVSSLLLQANLLQKIGRFEEAAKKFEAYAKARPKDKDVADVYFNAATLWDAINNDNKAVRNYEAYYSRTNSSDKAEVFINIAEIYENHSKYDYAIQYLKRFVSEYKGDEVLIAKAHHDIAKIYEKTGDIPKSLYWYRQIIKNHSNIGGKGISYLAEAKLQLAIQNFKAYEKITFPNDPNKQASVLEKKLQNLNRLNDEFSQVIKLNSGPQIIASLTYLGKAYEHFADAVLEAPKPKGLTQEELAQYGAGLKEVTKPRRDTAISFYKEALQKSKNLNLFDETTQVAYKALNRYEPQKYHWGQDYIMVRPSVHVEKNL